MDRSQRVTERHAESREDKAGQSVCKGRKEDEEESKKATARRRAA
jgi:hypothetical protein